jgi:hypothetical protein
MNRYDAVRHGDSDGHILTHSFVVCCVLGLDYPEKWFPKLVPHAKCALSICCTIAEVAADGSCACHNGLCVVIAPHALFNMLGRYVVRAHRRRYVDVAMYARSGHRSNLHAMTPRSFLPIVLSLCCWQYFTVFGASFGKKRALFAREAHMALPALAARLGQRPATTSIMHGCAHVRRNLLGGFFQFS